MGIQINGQNDSVTASDGSLSIGGNVSIPGVLTYEDVTSVDSVGIVTAQAGIHVTGGDVSIGHNNPSHKLDVVGNTQLYGTVLVGANNDIGPSSSGTGQLLIDANGYTPYIAADGTAMYIGHNSAARDLILQTDETDRLVIDGATGNVGIGTDNPSAELEINSDTFSNIKITSARTGATQQIGGVGFNTFTSDGTLTQASTINALVDGTLLIKNASSTERLRLNSSGNIGINTSDNINGKLTIQADDDDELLFQVRANNGRAAQLKSTASASNTDPFVFQTNNSWGFDVDTLRVLTLASDYNVGIGTDNPATNFKLDVNGDLSLGELGGSDNTYIDQKQNGRSLISLIVEDKLDSGGVRINKTNSISGDTTYFRDFEVYDGKDELLFLIDGSTGNIGIGTDNPATKLDVQDGDITIRNGSEHNAIRTTPDGKLQFLRNAAANNTVSVTIDDGNGNVGIGSTIPTQALDVDGRITKTEYEPGEIIERICSVCDGSTHVVKSGSYTITNVTSEQAGTTSDAVCSGSSIDYKCPAGAKKDSLRILV